ncbi:UDP-N-acetyl glucosamine 2-epimerase [Roseomonas sp. PWR1]|uniref:UDP-N-acetyl glucosamine 2-epimerase n=1 Tax=Roseomonas nitratireducens TaxID=2820810 RepID=A0ABS4ALS4_9PROT|nr:UDP-N-acetyl glucosamine 2-epimerase [Neoroseomonas nitratireducens]MBP0462310.1 UDP-N-acetyl glucosamine 2-epimerase [Neoroseomonas nitratireducens]
MAPILHLVVAARPNLPKIAALWHALAEAPPICTPRLLHTGQHHDATMFGDLVEDLGLPPPAIALGIAGGAPAERVARTMIACEAAWAAERPALIVVAGDVDGALGAGLAARKRGIRAAHLEAGLRCDDADMPEEVNRRALDAICDPLWAPDEATAARLLAEGHPPARVRAVGNAMADSLLRHRPAARTRPLPGGHARGGYGIVTLHRPANVDDPGMLGRVLGGLAAAARRLPLAWPMHPRTAARLAAFGFDLPEGVLRLPPLRYLDFLALMDGARVAVTDSGGVQEEAALLGLPCLTLRPSTERPVTLAAGGNRLVAPEELPDAVMAPPGRAAPIPLWDGRAGHRMRAHLAEILRP